MNRNGKMSDLKQVKVDNWGIYFLQRLKHFFNRTDYCDLTLQFQDNAQLKVHRLVLSACTEYFELLERTCEMYEDCLVMPDDLQADVVVPIVNFMYTGQLEFKIELLEKLYQTSQIMNMPVLSKLLDAQRQQLPKPPKPAKPPPTHSYSGIKHYNKSVSVNQKGPVPSTSTSKRTYTKAFDMDATQDKHISNAGSTSKSNNSASYGPPPDELPENHMPVKKFTKTDPRPTRYELPEELDTDNIYENSFSDISYTSTPLMVHPETTKRYSFTKRGQFNAPTSSKRYGQGPSTVEIVECRKVSQDENIYEDDSMIEEPDMFMRGLLPAEHPEHPVKTTNQLFDQILDNPGPKVTIEAKNSKQASKLDHAKIISEVLKKYPHLVNSNKKIKLKLLDTPAKPIKKKVVTPRQVKEEVNLKSEPDFTYETEVLDSAKAAKLIALGAENINGPWICLICGTPGRALHFTSYYKFRRHLVEVHNEKPVSNMCEYCGLRSLKRNYLLHHLYTKHGKKPPPSYHFPKCNFCNYIALNEGYLVKHKMTHAESRNFRCNVCAAAFNSSSLLLLHIQNTGHKYSAERKTNLQCVYCLKVFLRESNLYAHLKTHHKQEAKIDCIIDDSDDEKQEEEPQVKVERKPIKFEVPVTYDQESEDEIPFQTSQKPLGNPGPKKHRVVTSTPRQKILNSGFSAPILKPAPTLQKNPKVQTIQKQFLKDDSIALANSSQDEIIMIGDTEYIMRNNQLIPKNSKLGDNDEFILTDMLHSNVNQHLHSLGSDTSLEFSNMHDTEEIVEPEMKVHKKQAMNQPIQIVVSNEEEYKALMSSNHSIIFDDTDTRKRLTVLTGPHDSELDGTTIDLDSTQTNEMMIIQDDFPMNDSEAVVAPNNSNIVVVYSHPVGDQAKPYQLITSQALGGAQFVSTSAVLTRNFETVTTSAAVEHNQIIHNQNNWHNNLDQNMVGQQNQVVQDTELQVLTNVEEVVMPAPDNEIESKLEELPEVHMLPVEQKEEKELPLQEIGQIDDPMSQHNEHSEIPAADNAVIEGMGDDTSIPMEHEPVHVIVDTEVITITSKGTVQTENDASIQNQQEQNIPEQVSVEEKYDVEHMEQFEGPVTQEENIQNLSEPSEEVSEIQEISVQDIAPLEVNGDSSYAPVIKEQIENLASEWSDDDEIVNNENIDQTTVAEADNGDNNSVELEESVENIQLEVNKQMTRIVSIDPVEDSTSPTHEDMHTAQELVEDVKNEAHTCPEKISSLLNDWDENDSQEKNQTENAEIIATKENVGSSTGADNEYTTEDKKSPKKDDKIKRLVSDWDDEEDEDGTRE